MKRRSFIAGLLALPFIRRLVPTPEPVWDGKVHQYKGDTKFYVTGMKREIVVTAKGDMNYMSPGDITIYGVDIDGNPVSETIQLEPAGGTVVSKHAYKHYTIGRPYDT